MTHRFIRNQLFLLCIISLISLFPLHARAAFYPGYQRPTKEIYGTVRHGLAVYTDDTSFDLQKFLPAFTGVKATLQENKAWVMVEYTLKGKSRKGWTTLDEFYADCLIYDGREKQPLADGNYDFSWEQESNEETFFQSCTLSDWTKDSRVLPLSLVFKGHGSYQIKRRDSGLALLPDLLVSLNGGVSHWGNRENAGNFRLVREGSCFLIQDALSGRYLNQRESGLFYYDETKGIPFQIRRRNQGVLQGKDRRLFAQFDAEWANNYYGKGKNQNPESNNFCTSGCGLFAPLNAIYNLTGQYIDPNILADYAVKHGHRVEGNGTDSAFFKAVAQRFGNDYGFAFDGEGGTVDDLNKKLAEGDVAIAHVPGHYVAIVKYSSKDKHYLLLDPHYLPKRQTGPYGDWVKRSDLENGSNITPVTYYFYKVKQAESD